MLSKILEQFDKKFVESNISKIYFWKATALISCTEVRRFISKSIGQALNEIEIEDKKWPEFENDDFDRGYNFAFKQMNKNIKNFLNN